MKRRRTIKSAVSMLLLTLALMVAPRALAEDSNRVSQMKVQVWPEYDTPTVLVLIEGTLADASSLPRDVSVLVPSSATGIIATYENSDGTLAAEQTFKSEKLDSGFSRVTFPTKSANFHLEYYDDLLRGAPDKTMDFVYQSATPADKLTLEIQQPLQATDFSVSPSTATTRKDGGFTVYVSDYASVTVGQVIKAQVKYTKSDPKPSFLPTPVPAAVPATAPSAVPASSGWTNVYVVVGVIVVGFAAVLGFFMLQQRSRQPAPVPTASRRSKRAKATRAANSAFCTQCGRNLTSSDNFCPNCGAPRRAV